MRVRLAGAVVLLATACSGEPEEEGGLPALPPSVSSAVAIVSGERFAAYFGTERFDLAAVTSGEADFPYDAVEGPLSALTGDLVSVDLAAPSDDWFVSHNLHYAAGDDGDDLMWSPLRFAAGTEGLRGRLSVAGTADRADGVDAAYEVGYHGMVRLPGFSGNGEIELGASWVNTGAR